MRRMRRIDPEGIFIEYHLSQLGIRVTAHDCQLISRVSGHWEPLGPILPLPLEVPADANGVKAAANNTVLLTAWQYDLERPGSDIRAVLSQRKEFALALRDSGA